MKDYSYNLKLKAFDSRAVDRASALLLAHIKSRNLEVFGPLPLPTKREIITVLRSTHINKKSREQFALFTHKRLLRLNLKSVEENGLAIIQELELLPLPAGVSLNISAAGERVKRKRLINLEHHSRKQGAERE